MPSATGADNIVNEDGDEAENSDDETDYGFPGTGQTSGIVFQAEDDPGTGTTTEA